MMIAKKLATLYRVPEEVSSLLFNELSTISHKECEQYLETVLTRAQVVMELRAQSRDLYKEIEAFLASSNPELSQEERGLVIFRITKWVDVILLLLLDPLAPYICLTLQYDKQYKSIQKAVLQQLPFLLTFSSPSGVHLLRISVDILVYVLEINEGKVEPRDYLEAQ